MFTRLIAALVLVTSFSTGAAAQNWPTRPLTMIIPFAAGGPTDVLGRVMAERMGQSLGQQVVVENVGGAGGMTGGQRVVQAKPDGYTFFLGTVGTHAVNQTLYKRPLYDAADDFMPVALMAEVPQILITRKDLPANNLREFIAYAKANQSTMNFGSAGNGSAVHLGCLLLNAAMGTNVQHVPYRGSAIAMTDLQSGRLDFMCEIVSTGAPQVQGGTVKALATLALTRSPVLPELPTADEQGLKGFVAYTWNALFLPKGTPDAIAQRLRNAALDAMKDPAVRSRLEGLGATIVSEDRTTPEYLARFVRSEIEKWATPIKSSGVIVD
jgi:tripartite-type tricarboxylate transporter receptor subunit TctC